MATITSTRNERVKEVVRLHRRRHREEAGRYLVEGPNAVAEALAAGDVEQVFCLDGLAATYAAAAVDVVTVTEPVLDRLADSRTPQGVVAVARRRVARLDDVVGRGVLVVLVEPADPGNLGTIIRTADAAGAAGVVVAGRACDPWNPKAVRATTGSLTHLPVVPVDDVGDVLAACRRAGQRTVALDMAGSDSVFTLEAVSEPVALILGSEAHGLPAGVPEQVDAVLAVPTFGRAESLNLGAAAAVAMYAAARGQRQTAPAAEPPDSGRIASRNSRDDLNRDSPDGDGMGTS